MKKEFFNMGLRYHLMKSKDIGREEKNPSFFLINGQKKKRKQQTEPLLSLVSIFCQFPVYIYFKQ